MTMMRKLGVAAIHGLIGAMCAAPATASTLQEPGFTETVVDTIAPATNGFGGMILDAAGNLYFAANFADDVYIVPPGGSASVFGTNPGDDAQGVVIIGDTLYSSYTGSDAIYAQDLQQAAPVASVVASISNPMGMDVAPAGFGAFGGQLIVGTTSGVSAVNPVGGAETVIWNAGTEISDVAFTQDGRLVVTREDTGELVEVTAGGATSVLRSGLGDPDGIAVEPGTGDLFVTDPTGDQIWRVAADGSSATPFATDAAVDGGFFPSPIAFSVDGTELYYGTRESGTTIYRITGFRGVVPGGGPSVPIPVNHPVALLTLVLGLLALGGLAVRRFSA